VPPNAGTAATENIPMNTGKRKTIKIAFIQRRFHFR
jgi:hypothetical protein